MKRQHRYISLIVPTFALIINSIWYVTSPIVTEAEKDTNHQYTKKLEEKIKPRIVINLNTNKLTLYTKDNKPEIIELISQGKPGSYYETIGGVYNSDYKEPLHFSSIGHVYMPFSIHLFGNYFIHGIPYYPDGTKVSSTYSGGCVRLTDEDAKHVYDFITPDTPIIITRGDEDSFTPTNISTTTISSISMTRLMVAIISLEFLIQDTKIFNKEGISNTRKELIPQILKDYNINANIIYKDIMNSETFIQTMNAKAKLLGLTNTIFTDVNSQVNTTEEDYGRFMEYIMTYKSYLIEPEI